MVHFPLGVDHPDDLQRDQQDPQLGREQTGDGDRNVPDLVEHVAQEQRHHGHDESPIGQLMLPGRVSPADLADHIADLLLLLAILLKLFLQRLVVDLLQRDTPFRMATVLQFSVGRAKVI